MASTALSKSYAIFKRDAALSISYEAQFVVQWLAVVAQVVITFLIASLVPPNKLYSFDGSYVAAYFPYAIINVGFVSLQSTALQSFAKTIRDGQMQGTLEVVLSTPTSLAVIVLAGGLWAFVNTLGITIVTILVAIPFGLDLSHTNVLTLLAFLVLTMLSLSPLGVMSAAATMVLKQAAPFDFFLTTIAYMFGGVYVPVAAVVGTLIRLHWITPFMAQLFVGAGWLIPITHSLNGIRAAVAGARLDQMMPDVIWLAVASAILLPLSLVAFEKAVKLAKTDGTLGGY